MSLLRSVPSVGAVVVRLSETYVTTTSTRLKLVDTFLLGVLLTGIVQFIYCVLVGTFPFNSFLSGFISTVGTFCLTVALRFQLSNANEFKNITVERAFADWLFCNVVLHTFVISFMG